MSTELNTTVADLNDDIKYLLEETDIDQLDSYVVNAIRNLIDIRDYRAKELEAENLKES